MGHDCAIQAIEDRRDLHPQDLVRGQDPLHEVRLQPCPYRLTSCDLPGYSSPYRSRHVQIMLQNGVAFRLDVQ